MTKSILIADDEEELRELVAFSLRDEYDIETVTDGRSCWEALTSGDRVPDLLILDIRMPGPDGIQLLERIRDHSRFEDVPVVVLSACQREEDVVRALESGASEYVRKPFGPAELSARVGRLLG